MYSKDLSEPMYEFLIKKCKDAGTKYIDDPNAFIKCSNRIDENYSPNRQRKVLIVFDDMIANIMSNKKFQAVINELFIRCRKVNISLAVIIQFYFSVPKDVRLNSTHYLTMKISNRKELQNIAINHFVNIYYKPHSFLTIDTTLAASDLLRFRKKLLPSYKNDNN